MRNALYYNYGISISDIHKNNFYHYFFYNEEKYIIIQHDLIYKDLEKKYYMSQYLYKNGVKVNTIIKTNKDKLEFIYDEHKYVLMKINYDTTINMIRLDDIINFNNIGIWYRDENQYFKIWSDKIDYIEYQVSEMGKEYEYIRDSISYFIGIAENAISLSKNILVDIYCISHIKFSLEPFEFYNPLNFMVDVRIRDIAEYFKKLILEEKFNLVLFFSGIEGLSKNEVSLLYIRMLFPNYYFDLIEECLLDEKNDYKIKDIIKNIPYFEKQMVDIYSLLDYLPYIEWIK